MVNSSSQTVSSDSLEEEVQIHFLDYFVVVVCIRMYCRKKFIKRKRPLLHTTYIVVRVTLLKTSSFSYDDKALYCRSYFTDMLHEHSKQMRIPISCVHPYFLCIAKKVCVTVIYRHA